MIFLVRRFICDFRMRLVFTVLFCLSFAPTVLATGSTSASTVTPASTVSGTSPSVVVSIIFVAAKQVFSGVSGIISNWITWIASNTFVLITIGLFLIGVAVAFIVRLWMSF